jgi:NHLM bacteriocin system ABC transporter ATP-binding protein
MSFRESQINLRARLNEKMTEKAYAKLASSVSDPQDRVVFRTDDAEMLDSAVKTCLQYYGTEAGVVPENTEQTEDRIDYLCRPGGIMHRPVRLDGTWYEDGFGAMLAKLEDGTPVSLVPHGLRGFDFVEPGTGKRVHVTKANAGLFAPEAVFFYRALPAKSLTVSDLMLWSIHIFNRGDSFLILFSAFLAALTGLLPAWANHLALDTVIPSGQRNLILPLAGLLLGAAVARLLINSYRNLIISRATTKIETFSAAATYARVLMLPVGFFREYDAGDISARVNQMNNLFRKLTRLLLGGGLTALLSLIYLFQIKAYAADLAVPALMIVLLQAAFTVAAAKLGQRFEQRSTIANANLSGTTASLLNGVQKIKLSGAEDRAFSKWANAYSEYAKASYNRPELLRILPVLVSLIGAIGTAWLFSIAGSSKISTAGFMAFSVAYGQMSAAMIDFSNLIAEAVRSVSILKAVEPIMKTVPETASDKVIVTGLNGQIDVSGLSFRYEENSPMILDDISLKIHPGEYVGIVGKSGCGKTTLIRLLLGFEKPLSGSILYGSAPYDVENVDLRSLRRHIGTVLQDGRLFQADIYNNIVLSTPEATLDDAWRAAELAGIAEDIRKMPLGMNTIVSEGTGSISGGQRQRLLIARAICGERKILIFDEATSALDNITQKVVTDSLSSLQCTRIVVAHRLSTVQDCDRILVLDHGRIIEEGTYTQLMEKNGFFAELVSRQRLDEGV